MPNPGVTTDVLDASVLTPEHRKVRHKTLSAHIIGDPHITGPIGYHLTPQQDPLREVSGDQSQEIGIAGLARRTVSDETHERNAETVSPYR